MQERQPDRVGHPGPGHGPPAAGGRGGDRAGTEGRFSTGAGSVVNKIQLSYNAAKYATRIEYQGCGPPKDSDRNTNGYHD